ncbi:DUF2142 domain-containing protein [Thomasclavelia cocleata]|jgi:uncharacterized membrane protein|uniref:DUF2142 domain-containing protein n=1 Tax=Thomasclavelia cocleata TaxID=69824 RepID=UPI00242BEEE1|nr:DUF2142 domain-containing protein [Thomasclavelia cocleata]MCI9629460.1 DUF2142 domain-containing protein [Thomasclavelia cocleata]
MKHATNSPLEEKGSSKLFEYGFIILLLIVIMILYFNQQVLINDKSRIIMLVYTIIYILIGITAFILIKSQSIKELKIEKVFIICIIPLGIIYTLLFPQGIVPDEWTHMYFVDSLASQITGKEVNTKVTMRTVDVQLYNMQIQNPNSDYYTYIFDNIIDFTSNNEYTNINIDSVSLTSLFAYFPSVIGTIISRIFGFGAVMTVYFARLCNFAFYFSITYQAIKKLPFGKLLLLAITMLPMTCHQMFSLSYDAVVNATSFFCISYGLFFIYEAKKIQFSDLILYSICSILVLANKGSAYAFILVIPILAKYFNPNGDLIAKKTKIIIFLILIISILLLNYRSLMNVSSNSGIQAVSGAGIVPWTGTPSYTLSTLLNDIPRTINLFINTFVEKGWWYITTAIGGALGWLTILLPNWIINIWLGVLVLSSMSEKSNNDVFTYEHKLLYFLTSFGIILLVMLAMALAWTPMGYATIEGVQGRYFIPIIFLLFICLQNTKLYLKENMIKIVLALIPIMSVISIYNLIPLVL